MAPMEGTMVSVMVDVCRHYGLTRAQLTGRGRRFAGARMEAMAGCVLAEKWSLPAIGRAFGRDHTTVMHAARRWGVL